MSQKKKSLFKMTPKSLTDEQTKEVSSKFPKLSKKELKYIAKLKKRQHDADVTSFKKHVKFIAKYCFKNSLTSLSFKRTDESSYGVNCSFYSPLDFMTPARRRNVKKQLEGLSS